MHFSSRKLFYIVMENSLLGAVSMNPAQLLGKSDDPAAIFALMELAYDKDLKVKEIAQDLLDQKKKSESEVMSFAEIFNNRNPEQPVEGESQVSFDAKKAKLLSPITRLFEKKLGKEKADQIKSKMMPAIEKVYLKSVGSAQKPDEETGRKAMQEFLTSYLEAMSDLESIDGKNIMEVANESNAKVIVDNPSLLPAGSIDHDLQTVGNQAGEFDEKAVLEMDTLSEEISQIKAEEMASFKEENEIRSLPDTILKRAYEVAMLSEGDDDILKSEMSSMIKKATRDIRDAFGYAKKKFKSVKLTHLTKIKDGMMNINTDVLDVLSIESKEYLVKKRTGEKSIQTRVLVRDEDGAEAVLYLFDARGVNLAGGMKIKISKGYVKTISGETAITVGKRGNVYIVL